MRYLDTNIIVYSIENHKDYGNYCKKILQDIEDGKLKVACNHLVLVELINVLQKINKILIKDKKRSLDIKKNIDAVLSLPIIWFDLDLLIIKKASEYDYPISGSDYIHIATMEINSIKEIISADKELDKISTVKRVDPLKF